MDKYYPPPTESSTKVSHSYKMATTTRNLKYSCLCSYMAALSFGYVIGFSSPALPHMSSAAGPLNEDTASWFSSLVTIGGMFGCPIAGWLVEKIGRRGSLLAAAVPYMLGWGAIMYFSDVNMLYCGRFLTGFSSGMTTVCAPMFIAEISTKDMRGMLGSGVQLGVVIGILIVNLAGIFFAWRSLALIGAGIALVGLLMTLRVTDTPRYYLVKGMKPEAVRTLTWLRGTAVDVEEECRDMEESMDIDSSRITWRDFLKPELFQPLRASVGLMMFQQLSGINVVMFYTVSIFTSAGFRESAELAAVIIGIVQVIVTVISCNLMDRAGRRKLLFISGFGMSITCAVLGYYYYQAAKNQEETWSLGWLALTSLIIYIAAFAVGWGAIPMLVMSEIFPASARGPASGIASVSNWMFAFIVTKEFQTLQNLIGLYGVFWIFGAFCFLGLAFVWKFVPETKGKSLEDIELYFLGRSTMGRKTATNI